MTIGNLIRKARIAKKKSLQRLADDIGVSKQLVWQWENGESDPRKHIKSLSQHLEMPVDYFYGPARSPTALEAKIRLLNDDNQETIEMMIDRFLEQQEPRKNRPTKKA